MNVSKNPSYVKLEKFNGIDFKRWQQKILFDLTTMNLENIVSDDVPKADRDSPSRVSLMTIEAWKHFDFFSRNYILNLHIRLQMKYGR